MSARRAPAPSATGDLPVALENGRGSPVALRMRNRQLTAGLVANGRLDLAQTVAVLCAKPQNGAEGAPAAPSSREMRLPLGTEGVFGAQIDPTGRHGGG